MSKPSKTTVTRAEEFLLGNLVTFLVSKLKGMPDIWSKMSEEEQKDRIDMITADVKEEVRTAVKTIASDERPHLQADVDSVSIKDGIKVTLKVAKNDANRHELADSQGKSVLIVLPHVEKYLHGKTPVADPDQPQLPETEGD